MIKMEVWKIMFWNDYRTLEVDLPYTPCTFKQNIPAYAEMVLETSYLRNVSGDFQNNKSQGKIFLFASGPNFETFRFKDSFMYSLKGKIRNLKSFFLSHIFSVS